MKYKQLIINDETGEVIQESMISENLEKNKVNHRLCKSVVDSMLEKATKLDEIDEEMLYTWCKITRQINDRGQIKLLGGYRDSEMEKKLIEDITLTGYTMRIIDLAHNFSCILMKNHKTSVKNWSELFTLISCKNKITQQKVKRFCISNNIIREIKVTGKDGVLTNKLVLNPFLFRKASYSSQLSIMCFKDFIIEDINMSCYPLRWLQAMGYID